MYTPPNVADSRHFPESAATKGRAPCPMKNHEVFQKIAQLGVIPVIAMDRVEDALPLADALIEGGLPVIEITFRTQAAAEVIKTISRNRPELLLGAGTVLTVENLEAARACGAAFAVAPGLNPKVVSRANELSFPFVPGVVTPTDIEAALALDCTTLKFFPSEAAGGVPMLKALSAPYKHAGVRFVPTGGVSTANLESYLSLDTVAAVGGTWLATKDDIAAGRWTDVQQRCRDAVATVQRVR
ncbi:MAG: bifunctional 4-hydroxy-2-oxoglutarate aldolase/2-dehydro-3-deoxy-phosphogluconate aldolase [Thermoguttaceae bacterium]|nr:bifunctional 4-hydroxy-2-oxoglutarate aldolase/2-dehydro-3-deoxy-phosphogluconate aldolase [Thermoguttaceae bacterium]